MPWDAGFWGLEYLSSGRSAMLRIYIENDPITVEDCEKVSRQVASLLDLGRTGHVSALQKKLCELELENPESAEFIALLRNELDNFDLTNFLQLLSNNEVENDSR